jgi:hypothetical protein
MINRSSAAMLSMTDKINDRMQSQIDIVQVVGTGSRTTVCIWVKNIGTSRIEAIEQMDVFLGPQGDFMRIPYTADAGGSYPQWSYDVENDSEWKTGATLKITVTYGSDPGAGTYFVKVVIPNGIGVEDYFSM